MKLFFASVFTIFSLFIAACVYGYFLPANLTLERSVVMKAHSDDVYFYLEDLTSYRNWSALDTRLADAQMITGGADLGVGQNQAWQNGPRGYEFGSREIIQTQTGEFVVLKVNLAGQDLSTTYAVSNTGQGEVTVLSKIEVPQPGFPYLGRIRMLLAKADYERDLDMALQRLKVQVEASHSTE